MKLTKLILLSLSIALFAGCGEPDTNTPPTNNQDQQNDKTDKDDKDDKEENTPNTGLCKEEPKPDRCNKKADSYEYSRASYINSMKFPSAADVGGLPNKFGKTLDNSLIKDNLDVNKSIKDNIDNGKLQIILEFDGWKTTEEIPPTTKPDIMLWLATGTKPTPGAEVTIDKKSVASGVVPKGYFKKATFTSAAAGKTTVETEKTTLTLPINFGGISLDATLLEAQFHGKVVAKNDGVEIEEGKLSGLITKQSFLDGIIQAESECAPTCMTVNKSEKTCTAATDSTTCTGVCATLHELCSYQQFALTSLFTEKEGTVEVASAVLEVTGIPVKIKGISN